MLEEKTKLEIIRLRATGNGYRRIATILGIKADAVKNFCKLHGIDGYQGGVGKENVALDTRKIVVAKNKCEFCNKQIQILNGGRKRKYCSDSCRKKAWQRRKSEQDRI